MIRPETRPPASRVVGIDPGMSETGWAVLDQEPGASPRLVASGLVRTAAGTPLPRRLREIHEAVSAVLREHRPGAVAVEEMFFLVAATSVRSSLQARGVILLAAEESGADVREYNPRQVKSALTGNGAAAKPQVMRMTARALGLAEVLRPDDVSDAAAIAITHLRAASRGRLKVMERIGGGR